MDNKAVEKKRTIHGESESSITEISLFDWLAPNYDRLQSVLDPSRNHAHSVILDILNAIEPSPVQVLDLGCSTGLLTQQIVELLPDAHVYAIDGSLAMLEIARDNLVDFPGQFTLAKADFRDPWEEIINDPLDAVVHYTALHHLPHDALREVFTRLVNILRPGGWFIHGDFTNALQPEPVQRIAASIQDFQRKSAISDLPDEESLIDEFDMVEEANEAAGQLACVPGMPDQQIAWLIEAGFEFATRIFQDWKLSLFIARKPE